VLHGRARVTSLVDGRLLRRALGVLGPTEAVVEMAAFALVLTAGGWAWGVEPSAGLLAVASGTAFAAVVLGQLANAFACRSEATWAGRLLRVPNPLLWLAVLVELALLPIFLVGPVGDQLGSKWPSALGWGMAAVAVPAVLLVDALHKQRRASRRPGAAQGRSR
jgi:magnesium-transporting ATPase (P-type)